MSCRSCRGGEICAKSAVVLSVAVLHKNTLESFGFFFWIFDFSCSLVCFLTQNHCIHHTFIHSLTYIIGVVYGSLEWASNPGSERLQQPGFGFIPDYFLHHSLSLLSVLCVCCLLIIAKHGKIGLHWVIGINALSNMQPAWQQVSLNSMTMIFNEINHIKYPT